MLMRYGDDEAGEAASMTRKLKTYQTSLGFYDLAIAAPSMKAALEAWGADSNLFHQGIAQESRDPKIIAAATAKPGIVLRRPVGTRDAFKEHAELPTHLVDKKSGARSTSAAGAPKKRTRAAATERDGRKAAHDAAKDRSRRQRLQAATKQKERERRQRAINKAQSDLDKARQKHDELLTDFKAEQAALEKRAHAEAARWAKQEQKLEAALLRARNPHERN